MPAGRNLEFLSCSIFNQFPCERRFSQQELVENERLSSVPTNIVNRMTAFSKLEMFISSVSLTILLSCSIF